jgi:threonine/homoserine/homoserine lactone efflux protein
MNRYVRLGILILLGVLLLRVAFGVLALAMRLVSLLFPLLMLVGAGLIVYGIIRHFRRQRLGARTSRHELED